MIKQNFQVQEELYINRVIFCFKFNKICYNDEKNEDNMGKIEKKKKKSFI